MDMERLKQAGHRIIIGVDFGTTFTGVGWVDTASGSNVQDVFLINDWGGKAKTCDYNWKVPTIVAYQDENSSKSMKDDKWGFEVESSMVSWSWMKLLLDKGQAETHYDDSLQEVKQHPLKTAEQMISDYLRGVYQFLVKKLERRFGGEAIEILPFEFWFTIPAIWSDQAKVTTKRAAQAAGFASRPGDKIFLIPEPEAAAVAVLKELTHHGDSVFVEPGNGMIICDCGGGTIDITTYAICQTEPTLEFDEVVVGAGGKCGSTYIDRRFLIWMSNTFGSGFDNLPDRLKSPGSKLMKAFESAKREFKVGGYESYEVSLHIPGVRDSDFYDEDESQVKIPW
ncbi:hypothetical protein DIS24_g9254 [Lasiodiplodia hormozganensis]|uniref:Heat shock 70 kDa protein 12A n=1 Tax=Lasiodiplodia hormozganensis TaxID=869390 RepID=A0AA39XWV5_9PEZI|nr:hypothetical protein DIS24_g9254 [Lasiodiplodia hormozganensis]